MLNILKVPNIACKKVGVRSGGAAKTKNNPFNALQNPMRKHRVINDLVVKNLISSIVVLP